MRLLRVFQCRRIQRHTTTFLDLPPEIRQQIYKIYTSSAYVRYRRTAHPSLCKHPSQWIKTAIITGPQEHALLATCRTIRNEARSSLEAAAYLLLDRTDPAIALDVLARQKVDMPPFLVTLIQRVRRIVVSKPHQAICQERTLSVIPLEAPYFECLKTVELFGFYPSLQEWLQQDRRVVKGWHWHMEAWQSWPRLTAYPEVHLGMEGQWWKQKIQEGRRNEHNRQKEAWVGDYMRYHPHPAASHTAFTLGVRDSTWPSPRVLLRAFMIEEVVPQSFDYECYDVLVDVATKTILRRRKISWGLWTSWNGIMEYRTDRYHGFLEVARKRRVRWLHEERWLREEMMSSNAGVQRWRC